MSSLSRRRGDAFLVAGARACIRVLGVDSTDKVTRRFCESFAQDHRRPAAYGDLTDSFVPSFREPFLDDNRSERPRGGPEAQGGSDGSQVAC